MEAIRSVCPPSRDAPGERFGDGRSGARSGGDGDNHALGYFDEFLPSRQLGSNVRPAGDGPLGRLASFTSTTRSRHLPVLSSRPNAESVRQELAYLRLSPLSVKAENRHHPDSLSLRPSRAFSMILSRFETSTSSFRTPEQLRSRMCAIWEGVLPRTESRTICARRTIRASPLL